VAWRVHHLAAMSARRKHSIEREGPFDPLPSQASWSQSSPSSSPFRRHSEVTPSDAQAALSRQELFGRSRATTSALSSPSRTDLMKAGGRISEVIAVESEKDKKWLRRRKMTRRRRVHSEASSGSGEEEEACQCGGKGPVEFLRRTITRMKQELDYVTPTKTSFGVTLSSNSKFIAGSIFTPGVVGCMLARGSYTPGISEVMMKLINPDASRHEPFVWQIRIPDHLVESRFEDLWFWLLREEGGPVFALGLYRMLQGQETRVEHDPPQGYVLTNPHKDVDLRREDTVYVLAPPAWACKKESEGVLVSGLQQYNAKSVSPLLLPTREPSHFLESLHEGCSPVAVA